MITTRVIFDHRGRTRQGSEGPVEVRVGIDRKYYYINTGIKVRGRELRDGYVTGRADADTLNGMLAAVVERVGRIVGRRIGEGLPIDVAEIRREVYHGDNGGGRALLDWLTGQVPLLPIGEGTRRRYHVLLRRMEEYGRLLSWDDLTVENLYKWDAWLHRLTRRQSNGEEQAGDEPKRIGDAAVYNYHRTLRSLLTRAVKFGLIQSNPYDRVRGEFRKGTTESTEYLTEEEIAAVESLRPIAGTQMAMARDLFVFQMYTGLSYADAQAFDIGDYKMVGGRWINTGERIKTGVSYISRLLPQAVEVLERYGMQVPRVGNTQYNESLKVIQRALGIRTRLHSHLARHTFATRMLAMGAKLENVSRMLGHTNVRMTERYAKVLAKSVHDDFDMVAGKLAGEKLTTVNGGG